MTAIRRKASYDVLRSAYDFNGSVNSKKLSGSTTPVVSVDEKQDVVPKEMASDMFRSLYEFFQKVSRMYIESEALGSKISMEQ